MNDTRKKWVLALFATLLTTILLGTGILIGSYLQIRTLRGSVSETWRKELMGELIPPEERPDLARAYHEPEAVLEAMENFTWAVPNVPTPFVGTGPEPGTRGNATINRQQFRSVRDLPARREAGVARIFITGGSVAFGSGAPSQNRTIGGYLETELNRGSIRPRARVYTLANPAWTSTHERILIENRLSEWQPDLVISFSGLNDVHWGQMGRDVMWFRTYHEHMFWSLNDSAYRLLGRNGLVDVQEVGAQPVDPSPVAGRLAKNVQLAAMALRLRDVPYLFVLQPSLYTTGKELSSRESARLKRRLQAYFQRASQEVRDRMKNLREEGFSFLDLTTVFDEVKADIFLDNVHPADRGNELIARRLADAVGRVAGAVDLGAVTIGNSREAGQARSTPPARIEPSSL